MNENKSRTRSCDKCGKNITMSERFYKLKTFDHCIEVNIRYFHGDCFEWQ